jgi:hypothetical protein
MGDESRRDAADREQQREEREESRSALRKIAGYLGFADLMAFLMVAATALSGYATWRTATIADQLLRNSERPYFGVQNVALDQSRSGQTRIYVDYRNFGHVPADNVRIRADLFVDGKPLLVAAVIKNAGVMSPDVPHHVSIVIPQDRWREIGAGRASTVVQVKARYSGAVGSGFCYRERFAYASDSGSFEIAGGTSRCDSQSIIARP